MKTKEEIEQKLKEIRLDHKNELDVEAKVWISGRISILEWILR